jgi:hypothetical protein
LAEDQPIILNKLTFEELLQQEIQRNNASDDDDDLKSVEEH